METFGLHPGSISSLDEKPFTFCLNINPICEFSGTGAVMQVCVFFLCLHVFF